MSSAQNINSGTPSKSPHLLKDNLTRIEGKKRLGVMTHTDIESKCLKDFCLIHLVMREPMVIQETLCIRGGGGEWVCTSLANRNKTME